MTTTWQRHGYRLPTNWKQVWSLVGGAVLALLTLLAVAWGMIRADAANYPPPEPPQLERYPELGPVQP